MFKELGDAVKTLFNIKSAETKISHQAIKSFIEHIYTYWDDTVNKSEDTSTFKSFRDSFILNFNHNSRTNIYDKKIHKALSDMMKDLGVRNRPDKFMDVMVTSILTSRELLQYIYEPRYFDKIFDDLKTLDDIKVHHAYVFGLLALQYSFHRFFVGMIGSYRTKKSSMLPKYFEQDVLSLAPLMTNFVIHLQRNQRRYRRGGIIKVIDQIKNGVNLKLKVGEKDISEYANPGDIKTGDYEIIKMGFVGNIVPFIYDYVATKEHLKYEKRIKTKEWMEAKLSILSMDMAGIDPNDPEYKKKQKIYEAYTSMLADLEYKIRKYENEA